MRRFPFFKQQYEKDCGPTCLKMVAKFYGKNISIEKIRKDSRISRDGVSLLGLAEAAEKMGFKTIVLKITPQQLIQEAPKPAILHWNQNHFVVLTPRARLKSVTVADPGKEIIRYSRTDFEQHWLSINTGNDPRGIALILEPTTAFYEQAEEEKKSMSWALITRYVFVYKKLIFQLFLGLLLGSLLQLIFPYLTQSIVDIGINTNNLNFIQVILLAQFTLFFARTFVEVIRSRILLFISTHVNLAILSDFWIKLMRLPLSFFDSRQTGDILQRINDHHQIESFITGSALQTLFSLVNLLVFSIVLWRYSTTVFLIFIGGSVLYFIWISFFLKHRRKLNYTHFSVAARENSATMQLIQGMHEIKLNNAEKLKRWEWEKLQASLFNLNFRALSLNQYQQAGAFFINEGKNILITYFVAKAVLSGDISLGAMLAIQYIIGQLNSPVEQLIQFTQQAQDAKISLERLNEIHQLENEEPDDSSFNTHLTGNHSIQLRNLSFTYDGAGNKPVLKNINLSFPSGKITAIVGMSGSGKTTILKLLQKFYSTYEGEIKVAESDLKYLSPWYLRSITGSVMQDGFIFSDSIEKNIAVGDEDPDYEKLVNACRVANILHFVESMPLGFNTKIGAEGNGISAGQKQRILIARAVYKNPSFLFFDEATNALDADNEKAIMENLQQFFEGKTVVVVAHRLSTVKNADKIVVLQDGAIIEEGSHEELTYRKGKYYQLVKNQLELGN